MDAKTFLILGGSGNTGRLIARLLAQETDVQMVLAGRNLEKARKVAEEINRNCQQNRAVSDYADASDPASLKAAFAGTDMVIVASSTAKYARIVAEAALDAGIDYLDIQYSTKKVAALKSMNERIQAAGRCFITDGGFHPGLPAAMVSYAAGHFDSIEKANIGSVLQQDWASVLILDETMIELIEELNDYESLVFKNGHWKKANMLSTADFLTMDFGPVFRKRFSVPMYLEEMRALPEMYPTLKETGFYVGSFNWFVDWVVFPLVMLGMKISPQAFMKPSARLMGWGLKTFSKPPYGIVLQVEAQGLKDGQKRALRIAISHPDGYVFTAVPVIACLLQYLDGTIRKPGLWTQANLVEPVRLVKDMQRLGVEVKVEEI
jgi:saccharopine dehydrogenase-like NADP-dependent oxidoreductase